MTARWITCLIRCFFCVIGLACFSTLLVACSSPPAKEVTPSVSFRRGLDVTTWSIEDRAARGSSGTLLSALSAYADQPVPLSDQVVDAWRRNGMRPILVPVADLERLEALLPMRGTKQQQRFGELSLWTSVHTGPESEFALLLELDDGPLRLTPGMVRLIIRAFVVPGQARDGEIPAEMQLEMLVQHVDPSIRPLLSVDLSAMSPLRTEEEGTILARVSATARLNDREALIIIPESLVESTSGPVPDGEDTPMVVEGPTPPSFPSVGQALLTDYSRLPEPSVRSILIFRAHVPPRFDLGRDRSAGE